MKRLEGDYDRAMRIARITFWTRMLAENRTASTRELARWAGCSASTVFRGLREAGFAPVKRGGIRWEPADRGA